MKNKQGRNHVPEKVKLPSITMKKGAGFHVSRAGEYLVIVLPLTEPRPSSTGKTNVIGSTGGPRVTFAKLNGAPVMVTAVAMVKPKVPAWRLQIHAVLARWEGRLA
jgi:hypothetical protein